MPQSKVTNVRKIKEWVSGQGVTMYVQQVNLADGMTGEANSKNPNPPYAVGDEVTYEVTREFQGVPQLKIQKVQQGGYSGGGQGGFRKGGSPGHSNKGMRVGMAVNNAVLLCCHGKIQNKDIPRIAQWIYDLAGKLEGEETAQTTPEPQKPAQAYSPQPQAQSRPAPAQVPVQESENLPDDEDDIPF